MRYLINSWKLLSEKLQPLPPSTPKNSTPSDFTHPSPPSPLSKKKNSVIASPPLFAEIKNFLASSPLAEWTLCWAWWAMLGHPTKSSTQIPPSFEYPHAVNKGFPCPSSKDIDDKKILYSDRMKAFWDYKLWSTTFQKKEFPQGNKELWSFIFSYF